MLEIDGVSKRFGSTVALDGMTLTVRPGELYGFVGANGAGKTTTMRIALGVLAADAGEVRLDGRPLDAASRRRIGYMPEERGLYPRMAVGTQLRYLAELRGRSAADARAAADRWTERLGIADRRGDEVQRLSLGNQRSGALLPGRILGHARHRRRRRGFRLGGGEAFDGARGERRVIDRGFGTSAQQRDRNHRDE